MELNKQLMMRMGLITLVIPLIVVSILYFFHFTEYMQPMAMGYFVWYVQLGFGILGGGALILAAAAMGKWKYLDAVNASYTLKLGGYQFSTEEIIYLSLCAGIGEEILFRGVIQPYLGLFITSFMFIAMHGYIRFKSIPEFIFGMSLFGIGMGLGILAWKVGLLSAIIAHSLYDMVAFMRLQKDYRDRLQDSKIIQHEQEE